MAQLPGIPYTEYEGNPSTGAPGSGHDVTNATNPSGAPTSDLVHVNTGDDAHDFDALASGISAGVGEREDPQDVYRPDSFGAHAPSSTHSPGTPRHDFHE